MSGIVYGGGVLRDEIGEPGSGRRLTYVWGMHVSAQALDDPPIMAALEGRVLDDLLRQPDLPDGEQDVCGPAWVTEDRAREWHDAHVSGLFRDFEAGGFVWPSHTVLLVVGAYTDRPSI